MIKSTGIKVAILKNTDDGKISEQFDTSVWKELLLRRALVVSERKEECAHRPEIICYLKER